MSRENKLEILRGAKGIIMGVMNRDSIAYYIAKACVEAGAEIALTYQNEALLKRIAPIAEELGCKKMLVCDVSNEANIESVFQNLCESSDNTWSKLDFVVHSIGFSDKNELKGEYMRTSKDNFLNTMDVSCYSLVSTVKYANQYFKNSSVLTLTYYGAEKVIPNYNVMGVAKAALEASVRYLALDLGRSSGSRINAISAGPINTMAARGISDFNHMLNWAKKNSPLHRNVRPEEVANTAVYLLSDLSSGVTGQVLHVDSGVSIVGCDLID